MNHRIILAPEAVTDLKRLKTYTQRMVRDGIEIYLRHEPTKESRSRIKRLSGLKEPEYRLRLGEARVFYDVKQGEVQILAIVAKSEAATWLERKGEIT